ncbi:restriction endonuclease subunit S [Vibrio campbellii]|uniref:restriction endonuclease subunit S n=1 Tax=Vibrio campbellii TaxID=680 RepID=UPI00210E4640|nr:restriction endonuclease subunit S [Vibrio campbellii]UTZ35923.1 restriction endonuclease subunit S [Vibrio campbellii]
MVPNGWEQTTISSISKTIMGFAFKSTDFVADGMPLIRMGNLYQNQLQLDRNPVFLPTNFAKEYERFVLRSGDLVMSMTGTMGKRDYGFTVQIPENTQDCLLNQRVMKFEEKSNSNRGFLKYLLKSEHVLTRLYSFPGGTKQANLSAKQVGEIPVLLPPLPEQRKIAQILSTWDHAIATTEKLIDASKQQKKALMQQLLTGKKRLVDPETGKAFEGGWEDTTVATTSKCFSGGTPSRTKDEYYGGTIPWITSGKLNDRFVESVNEYITESGVSNSSAKYVKRGALLVAMYGATAGKVAINRLQTATINQAILALEVKEGFSNIFLFYLLEREMEKTLNLVQGGQPNLNAAIIKGVKIKLPSLVEQQKIASVLTAADKDIELLEAKLAHFKQEKKALMQQLLTGKRRVKVPETEAA